METMPSEETKVSIFSSYWMERAAEGRKERAVAQAEGKRNGNASRRDRILSVREKLYRDASVSIERT